MTSTATTVGRSMAARPRNKVENTSDPRGQFGAFLRHWIDTNHDGDPKRLADALGVSVRAVQTWMKGQAGPTFADLGRIASELGFADWSKLAAAVVRHSRK